MNKRFLSLGLIAGLVLSSPLATFAAEKKTEKPAGDKPATEKPAAESGKPVPFHGKVTAVDPSAHTFSLKGKEKDRIFDVSEQTTIVGKDGAAAKLEAITVGEEVRGSAVKSGETWHANKVTIGAKEKDAGAKPKGAKGAPGATPAAPAKPGSDAPAEKPAQ